MLTLKTKARYNVDGHNYNVPFLSIGISILTVLLGLAEQWITYKDMMHTIILASVGGTVGWLIQRGLNKLVTVIEKYKQKRNNLNTNEKTKKPLEGT